MEREVDRERGAVAAGQVETEAASAAPASPARFATAGSLPGVAPEGAARPTASELAYEGGPGVRALADLLAHGPPRPAQVVDLIDAHRGETQAMFALVESKLGGAFVEEVRDAMDLRISLRRKELVAGDPTREDGGYFLASASEQGARWRTRSGAFTGKAGKDGLDASYRLDDDDRLHARVDSKGNGALAWERDGRSLGELYRTGDEVGARRRWDLAESGELTAGVRNRSHDGRSTAEAFATHTTSDKKLTSTGAFGVNEGQLAGMAEVTYAPGDRERYSGSLSHDAAGTRLTASAERGLDSGGKLTGSGELTHHARGGWTGSLSGAYEDDRRRLDGSFTRSADQSRYHLGATERLSPEQSLYGSLDHVHHDAGGGQTTLRIGERYRSPSLVHDVSLEAGKGQRDYLAANGSLDAQLAPKLYGGMFGSFRVEDGHQTSARLGASLTFTPSEKTALTLAGVVDEHGTLETRLQLDVFKSKIDGVGALADHKKDALVSLFLSYQQGGTRALDDRYGAATLTSPVDDRVMAGIKIKF